MNSHDSFFWSDEAVATLRKLAADGYTCSQIAAQLHNGTSGPSRSAVIGKLHRLGQSGRVTTRRRRGAASVPEAVGGGTIVVALPPVKGVSNPLGQKAAKLHPGNIAKKAAGVIRDEQRRATGALRLPAEPVLPPRCEPVGLLELNNRTCRWPIGDPQDPRFGFCGAREADLAAGRSYCRYHQAIACSGSS